MRLVALLVLVACNRGEPSTQERDLAQPHLEAFEEYERWALRTLQGAPAMDDLRRVEATLFAPLRLERTVAGAWVQAERLSSRTFAFRLAPELLDVDKLKSVRFGEERYLIGQVEGESGRATIVAQSHSDQLVAVAFYSGS